MFFRIKPSGPRSYVQIVESFREEGRVRQRVICTLGRTDELSGSGELAALLESGSRLVDGYLAFSAHSRGEAPAVSCIRIGAPLIFERLWAEIGCREVISSLAGSRKHEFSLERAVFLSVLHRLVCSGSDRAAERWRQDYAIEGTADLDLHHLYRAMAWLGEELDDQVGVAEWAKRCTKDRIEEALFARRRDLFTDLELVFFDTTSIYFEGEGGTLGAHGYSKDHRPDLKQMIVGAVIDSSGHPLCCELWPGNVTDVKTLLPVIRRLKDRFGIGRVCFVADRGLISQDNVQALEDAGIDYILGARMRRDAEVSERVLRHPGRFQIVRKGGWIDEERAPLEVKEVVLEGRRYVICRNDEQAAKDAADREAILKSLKAQLKRGAKQLVGNTGYRRFLKASKDGFTIDLKAIEREARYDGKWVLRTNTQLPTAEVALKYKQLWTVEDLFRTTKTILDTRPIFHRTDAAIRGHVFCSFLALVLRKALRDKLDAAGESFEWQPMLADLDALQYVDIVHHGNRYRLRTATRGAAGAVFKAVGVALPPTLQPQETAQAA